VAGRLVDEEGRGLRGWITVWAEPGPHASTTPTTCQDAHVAFDLATDPEGRFTFAAPAGARLRIDAFLPGRCQVSPLGFVEADEEEVTLVLPTRGRASVRGHVRDAQGKPIVGARIVVRAPGTDGERLGFSTTGLARTDAEGAFSIDALPPTHLSQVAVEAPGFVIWNRAPYETPLIEGKPLDFDVTLVPGARLVVRVVDEANTGLPGAEVRLVARGPALFGGPWSRTVMTGPDGVARVEDVPPRGGALRVWAPGHYLAVAMPHPLLDDPLGRAYSAPTPGGERDLLVVMQESPTLRGTIEDARGRGVSWAALTFTMYRSDGPRGAGFESRRARTDAEGRFELGGLPPLARLTLRIDHEDHPPVETEIDPAGLSEEDPLHIVLPEPARVAGRVVDAAGQPVADVLVSCEGARAPVRTDLEGGFMFAQVAPGRRRLVAGTLSLPDDVRYLDLHPGQDVIDVTLRRSGTEAVEAAAPFVPPSAPSISFVVDGVVVDDQGVPVDAANVRAADPGDGPYMVRGQSQVIGGRFRVRVRGAPRALVLHVVGARDAKGRLLNVLPARVLVTDPEAAPLRVILQPALHLRGRFVEEDGRPIAHLGVTLFQQDPGGAARHIYTPPLQVLTDEDGWFDVPGLDDRPYRVGLGPRVMPQWIPPEGIVLRPGGEEVEIRLLRWQSLVAVVMAPDGAPLKGCRVQVEVLGPQRHRGGAGGLTDEEGRVSFPRLRPHDELTLHVFPPEPGEGVAADLLPTVIEGVSPGGALLSVRLPVGLRLGGRVLDAAGRPVPLATVSLQFPRGVPHPSVRTAVRTDATGAFVFRRLRPDQVLSIRVNGPKDAAPSYFSTALKDLVAGSECVEVVLEQSVSIEGRVPSIDPRALSGVVIRARPLLEGFPRASFSFTGKETTFKLEGLRPGPYTLNVRGGRDIIHEPAQTVEAPAAEVVLHLRRVFDLAGAVLGTNGNAFRVEFHTPGQDPITGTVERDGLFHLHRLPDVRGTLLICRKAGTRVALLEDVDPGRGDPLVVELAEGRPIEGRIVGAGQPLAGGRVIATRGSIRFEGVVTEEGAFRTPALPAGAYTLTFTFTYPKDGHVPVSEVVEAGTTDLVLEWATRAR